MAITRIQNNQITDSSEGNVYLGVNAAAKVQNFSVTGGKLQNNLTYGSDFTITGNLTVQGNTTTIDTVNLVVEDPLILLAKEQSGAPSLDIGYIGKRGTEDNIAFVWDESADEFVTVFTTSENTNTTISINAYASLRSLNIAANGNVTVAGTSDFNGLVTLGNITFDASSNIQVGNNRIQNVAEPSVGTDAATKDYVDGVASSGFDIEDDTANTTTVSGGDTLELLGTADQVSVLVTDDDQVTFALTSNVSVAGNVTGGNLLTGGVISATGNATAANMLTAGAVSATGNVTGGNIFTAGQVSATGNITANYFIGNGSQLTGIDATSIQNGTSNVKVVSSGGNVTVGIGGTGNIAVFSTTGLDVTGVISATGTATVGNVATAGTVSATGNITGGNVLTGGAASATGNVTGGNITTAGLITATGNVTGGNLITLGDMSSGTIQTTGNAVIGGNLIVQGNITYINIDDLRVEDPVIIMGTGANGVPPSADDGQDRGIFMEYYSTAWANAFVGWDRSANSIFAATSVNFSANNVVNVLEYGPFTAGNANLQSANVSGNVSGGNITTGGLVTATGNVTGGNVTTGGLVTATGNVTGGNLATGGTVSATGTATLGNVATGGTVSAGGNVTGGNLLTGGLICATGNVTAGNVSTGIISATGNINGTGAVFSGNVSATTFIGNISGNIDAAGANTEVQFNNGDLLAASANFTFDTATNIMSVTGTIQGTTVSATGNVIGGNVTTAGLVTATGNVTGGNLVTGGLATVTGNVTGGNITTAGLVTATGNVTAANLVLASGTIDGPASGTIAVNGTGLDTDFSVSGDTVANILFIDAGVGTTSFGNSGAITNAIASFNTTDSIILPRGNTAQRPNPATVGMFRFNTTSDALEVYNSGSGWVTVEQDFTVIVADSFTGNGVQTVFTLTEDSTTAGTIVSINGVVQIPTTAYSVSGNALTFTEAPSVSDAIDARILTTSTTVASLTNASGNASVECLDAADTVQIEGNLLPSANVTYNLGSPTKMWNNAYFNGSTIFLGNLQLKQVNASTFGVFQNDGTTAANVDVGSIDVSSIIQGTSEIGIAALNGNAYVTVGGTANVIVVSTGGTTTTGFASVTGNVVAGNVTTAGLISATGNITGNFILGNGSQLTGIDATSIQSGTSNVRVSSSGGPVTVGVGGSDILRFTTTGIQNDMGNGVGNIGNATAYFNTVFAKATSAQYADLAEMYEADGPIEPGTVVAFGGAKEVTTCGESGSRRVAGVVSTNPSYIMNAGLAGDTVVAVALTGRVPTKVTGTVRKGDLMIAAGGGRARAEANPPVGAVIGKALADFDGAEGTIEVVVGRL